MNEILNTPPGSPERIEETRQDDAQAVAWRANEEGREPFAEAAAEAGPEPGHVPISALLDEREKHQAERAQREALERQIADWRAMAEPPPAPEDAVHQALYAQNLRASRRFAEREYGKEAIAAVHDWAARRCDEDPQFNQQMHAAEDPYEAACHAFNREQILQTVKPSDLAAFKAWRDGRGAQAAQAQTGQLQAGRTPAPPRTLAGAPGNGGSGPARHPIGPGQAFAAVIRG